MTDAVDRRRFMRLAGGALTVGASAACRVGRATSDPAGFALPAAPPADAAAWPEVARLLHWLQELRARAANRVISGQQIRNDAAASYQEYVSELADRTGRHVAMVGVGYNAWWHRGISPVLIDHWRAGGLVTMEFHASNPWAPDRADPAGVADDRAPKPDLRRLLEDAAPSSERAVWAGQREGLGDALSELAEAGVVVLLRVLHEGNGAWFWWGQDKTTGQTAARELYRDTFDYLTTTRGLHNLLWVYSPAASWDGPAMQYYPGDDVVDLVAPTRYDDEMLLLGGRPDEVDHVDYTDLLRTGKPIGFGECGPDIRTDGSWDHRVILRQIRERYREMVFFHCWHGWDGVTMELVSGRHATELMNDRLVISRETIDWRN